MRFGSFLDLFNCYLWMDITAYADIMQVFRLSFFQRYHLDVFLYPSLPSASWDAVLRCGSTFQLIQETQLYQDVRKAMMGGLCAVFQPRSTANAPEIQGYDPSIITTREMYLDINSMYPDAMTQALPVSEGQAVRALRWAR